MLELGERRTRRLVLRRITGRDRCDLERMHRDPEVMATLGGAWGVAENERFLQQAERHWAQHGFGLWTARDPQTDALVGRGGLRHVVIGGSPELEVAYALLPAFWGLGLATELARESVRVGLRTLRRPELVSFTQVTNRASRRVMEKAGFRYEREVEHAGLPHMLYRVKASGFDPLWDPEP